MKKILLAIALVLMVGLGASAQRGGRDGFFNDWQDVSNGLDRDDPIYLPGLPGSHGLDGDITAPLGSGLVVLTALGAGYVVARRKKE